MIALDLLGRPLMVTYSCSSFRFQPLDGAIKILQPNYFMCKIYLPHAYRPVPIEKTNLAITTLLIFFDPQLPFCAKSSPESF